MNAVEARQGSEHSGAQRTARSVYTRSCDATEPREAKGPYPQSDFHPWPGQCVIPILFIEPSSPDAHAELILASCSEVVAPNQCTRAGTSEVPVGTVTWRSPSTVSVRVEVPPRVGERTLEFEPEDQPEARSHAVGLILGALVLELGAAPPREAQTASSDDPVSEPSSPGPALARIDAWHRLDLEEARRPPGDSTASRAVDTPTAPRQPAPRSAPASGAAPAPTETVHHRYRSPDLRWTVGMGGFVGPGLDPGPWRVGASAQAGLMVYQHLGIGCAVLASASPERNGLRNRWLTGSIGTRFEPRLADEWDLLLHAGLALERWTTRLGPSGFEGAESANRTYLGFRSGAGVGVRPEDFLRISLGISVTTTPGTTVRVAGDTHAVNPPIGLTISSAAEIGIF